MECFNLKFILWDVVEKLVKKIDTSKQQWTLSTSRRTPYFTKDGDDMPSGVELPSTKRC